MESSKLQWPGWRCSRPSTSTTPTPSSSSGRGRRCLCLEDLFDRKLDDPRGLRCGPTSSIMRGGMRAARWAPGTEGSLSNELMRSLQAQHGGAQRRRRRVDLQGEQAPEGLGFLTVSGRLIVSTGHYFHFLCQALH